MNIYIYYLFLIQIKKFGINIFALNNGIIINIHFSN